MTDLGENWSSDDDKWVLLPLLAAGIPLIIIIVLCLLGKL